MAEDKLAQVVSQVAEAAKNKEKKIEETLQLLVFKLDNEEYAVSLTDLKEIIRVPDITPIPNAPEFIKGILNLRGKIVVVVDLEKRFNLVRENETAAEHIVVTEVKDNNFGVIVDKVEEVINVPQNAIKPTPDLVSTKIHADYLKGVVVLENDKNDSRILILLDIQKLLQEKELLQLGEMVKQTINDKKDGDK